MKRQTEWQLAGGNGVHVLRLQWTGWLLGKYPLFAKLAWRVWCRVMPDVNYICVYI